MQLIKNNWDKQDILDLEDYLFSLGNLERAKQENKIINTKQFVLSIHIPELRVMANEIFKGNYISFLDLNPSKYYEEYLLYRGSPSGTPRRVPRRGVPATGRCRRIPWQCRYAQSSAAWHWRRSCSVPECR